MTKYLVLRKHPQTPNTSGMLGWAELARVSAASADAAIREAAEKHGAGEYVAIPARSWKPRTAKVQQTTKVDFS